METLLVAGATGGIGRELVARLAGPERILLLAARDPDPLAELAATVPGARTVAADLAGEEGAAALEAALDGLPPLAGFASCVGALRLGPLHRLGLDAWRACQAANLDSAFVVVRSAVRRMLATGTPCAGVLVASVAATVGLPQHEAMAAAKAGVAGLVRSAAASYAGQGLRLNAVAPALVETPATARLLASEPARAAIAAQHPLGRWGTAGEVAAAIAWLLGPEAAWITGQVLGIDGGMGELRVRR